MKKKKEKTTSLAVAMEKFTNHLAKKKQIVVINCSAKGCSVKI